MVVTLISLRNKHVKVGKGGMKELEDSKKLAFVELFNLSLKEYVECYLDPEVVKTFLADVVELKIENVSIPDTEYCVVDGGDIDSDEKFINMVVTMIKEGKAKVIKTEKVDLVIKGIDAGSKKYILH